MKKAMKRSVSLVSVILTVLLIVVPLFGITAGATEVDTTGATTFVFTDDGIAVTEGNYTGYKISGTALTINGSGVYSVSGSCSDGSVTVKKGTEDVVLILNGIDLTSSVTAPIACNKQSSVTIYVAESTVNTLTDSAYNNDELYTDNADAENAVIKCKDGSQVTICGTGTLNVNSYGKNGIKGGYDLYEEDSDGNATDTLLKEAWLTIDGPTININATVNDGLKSDKLLNIYSGNITVTAADDGIKCDYTLNIGKTGTAGPTITVKSATEGIEGATVNVYSGNVTVNASDDGINAANSDLTGYSFSYNQYGGSVYVNVTNGDGIDSNGKINLNGGTLEVYTPTSGDGDPIDSDSGIVFGGATVLGVGHMAMAQTISASVPYVTFGASAGAAGPGMQGQNGGSAVSISAGSTITITDSNNNVLYTAKAVRAASYVIFSSSALTSGGSYTLKVNGSSVATATAATASGGQGGGIQPGGGEIPEGALPFTDVKSSSWYFNAVCYNYENGLMYGMSDTVFSPDTTTTRAMVAALLYRMAGSPEVEYSSVFSDVTDGEWYTDAVVWAAENGIYAGYPDGSFKPNLSITREQLAAVIYRYAAYRGDDTTLSGDLTKFSDYAKVSDWAEEAVKWAVGAGVISGSEGKLLPTGTATRAQLAQVIYAYLDDGSYVNSYSASAGDFVPGNGEMPTPPGGQSGEMPTPPGGQSGEMPTPPGGGTRPF